ncbi:MAG: sigma-70 family RNA polymerase sigma factor [Hyphomicrobium sp.]
MQDRLKRHRFERLAQPVLDALFRTTRRMTGNAAIAQEIVQEACLRAYQEFAADMEGESFRPWLFRIAINLSLDHLRRRGREVSWPVSWEGTAIPEPRDGTPGADPARVLESKELGSDITRALDGLSPEHRLVAILVIVEEMSYAETAAALDISVDLVRSRLFRARALLRERLLHHASNRAADAADTQPEQMISPSWRSQAHPKRGEP